MQVHTVPLLSDNYAYIIAAQGETEAAVVDPAEPEKVLAAADALGLKITTILTTHQVRQTRREFPALSSKQLICAALGPCRRQQETC